MDRISRSYDINDRITKVFEKCINDGYRWEFGTLIVEKIIVTAIKEGLVQYCEPKPYGTFDQRKAAEEQLAGHYMILTHPMETGAEITYALMIKADTFEEAEEIRQSTKDATGLYVHDYSWHAIIRHGKPEPDMILKHHAYLEIVWLSRQIENAKRKEAESKAWEAKYNPEKKGAIPVTDEMVKDAMRGVEHVENQVNVEGG